MFSGCMQRGPKWLLLALTYCFQHNSQDQEGASWKKLERETLVVANYQVGIC